MEYKSIKVSNPLTIIAIFASVAEACATIALVKLTSDIQAIFVYFVMAFPTLLVVLFFLVLILLILKPHALYAPSDYADQSHFLIANRLKNSISDETEKMLIGLSNTNRPVSKNDIGKLKTSLAESILRVASTDLEGRVHEYLKEHASEAYTDRSLGHILTVSRRSVRHALDMLELKGVVVKGIEEESGILLWQIKDNERVD